VKLSVAEAIFQNFVLLVDDKDGASWNLHIGFSIRKWQLQSCQTCRGGRPRACRIIDQEAVRGRRANNAMKMGIKLCSLHPHYLHGTAQSISRGVHRSAQAKAALPPCLTRKFGSVEGCLKLEHSLDKSEAKSCNDHTTDHWGTVIQTGRSLDLFPMRSVSYLVILLASSLIS
jgi:hypothetical protein